MIKILYVPLLVTILYHSRESFADKIDPELKTKLENGEKVNVVVHFSNEAKPAVSRFPSFRGGRRPGGDKFKIRDMIEALKEKVQKAQADIIDKLQTRTGMGMFKYFKKYWTSNTVFIKEADEATVNKIAEDPNVSRIQIEPILKLEPKVISEDTTENRTRSLEKTNVTWNTAQIQAPEAWEELGGNQGEGVVVGIIDSGVRHTHERIRDSFRGEYGWFDAVDGSLEPHDIIGHGTGVTAMVAGSGGLGVAPGVKWMACRACNEEGCPFEYISDCMTFMACPTLPDGSNKDCSKAPKVINVSIGDDHGKETNKEDILALRSLGIFVVYAIGNNGPECATTWSAGELSNVIGVGATGENDVLYAESGIGPAYDGHIKPDLVAPGDEVMTAGNTSDTAYWITSGSSFAAPHVTGVIALLFARNPNITYDEIYDFLTQNTDYTGITIPTKNKCPDLSADEIPNNFFGYGRLNAYKAVRAQTLTLEQNQEEQESRDVPSEMGSSSFFSNSEDIFGEHGSSWINWK